MALFKLEELPSTRERPGFVLIANVMFNCDWNLIKAVPKKSTRYLRLKVEHEQGYIGFAGDFVDTGVIYLTPEDCKKEVADINFDHEYLPIGDVFFRKAVFLDRDGVLIEDTDYPGKKEDVIFKTDVLPFLKMMKEDGFEFIIVTNQSGIGRGKYSESDFKETTKYIEQHYTNQGIDIMKTYHCPFHVDASVEMYRRESGDRKPAPGMILRACEEFAIDLSQSIMVGDNVTDRIHLSALKSFVVGKKTSDSDFSSFADLAQHLKK